MPFLLSCSHAESRSSTDVDAWLPCRTSDHAQSCALLRLVATAVASWHGRGMVHGGLCPSACHWFATQNRIKLGGLSTWAVEGGLMPVRPDARYAAPEVSRPYQLLVLLPLLPIQRDECSWLSRAPCSLCTAHGILTALGSILASIEMASMRKHRMSSWVHQAPANRETASCDGFHLLHSIAR